MRILWFVAALAITAQAHASIDHGAISQRGESKPVVLRLEQQNAIWLLVHATATMCVIEKTRMDIWHTVPSQRNQTIIRATRVCSREMQDLMSVFSRYSGPGVPPADAYYRKFLFEIRQWIDRSIQRSAGR